MSNLDQLLKGLDLRSESDSPQPVFQKIISRIGAFFDWKSAEVEVSAGIDGTFSFKPRVEFGASTTENETVVPVEGALNLLNRCLADIGKTVWIAIDRLDEAFQGYPETEIPALRALFRSYLDLLEFDRIKLKLFVRQDLFSRIIEGGFVNLTHVNAKKVDIIWDEEDLLNLLCKRVKQNSEFKKLIGNGKIQDRDLFYKIFPPQVDQGSRKPDTWVWMMGRIRDGNGIKPPRNLIDLVSMAKDAQLRREAREPREFEASKGLIEADALRKALSQLSETRVNDTLLAEAKSRAPLVEKFRGGKSEHNEDSIVSLLKIDRAVCRSAIKSLVEIGFLEEIGGNYKIPMLYRNGLEITQGKAFGDLINEASEEE